MSNFSSNSRFDVQRHAKRITRSTSVAVLESIVGRDVTLIIIGACAGRDLFVRSSPLPDDELTRLIGIEAAQAIADELLSDADLDAGGRNFFIDQPSLIASTPEETVFAANTSSAPTKDQALCGVMGEIEEICARSRSPLTMEGGG